MDRAKAAQLDDLNDKRERYVWARHSHSLNDKNAFRLRQKINTEEEAFELEYQNRTTQKSDLGIKERQDRLMALKDEREEKRRNFVQQKKLQQALYIYILLGSPLFPH